MKELPLIMIIDKKGRRDPLIWDFYFELRHYANVHHVDAIDEPLGKALDDSRLFFGKDPDYILWGFQLGTALEKTTKLLNTLGIPIILSVGDVRQFIGKPKYTMQFWGLDNIKYILYKQRKTEDPDPHLERLKRFRDKGWIAHYQTREKYGDRPETFLRDAKIIHVPWGIYWDDYPPPDYEGKDIDISHICSIHDAEKTHQRRAKDRLIVESLRNSFRVFTKNVYGEEYNDVLRRSKILVVDTADSGIVTQKYIEGAMHGCLLVGERPSTDTETFRYMIESEDLHKDLLHFHRILTPDRCGKLYTDHTLNLVKKNYNIQESVKEFVREVLN